MFKNKSSCKYIAYTAQKTKSSIKDFFSRYGQIPRFLRIWSHLLNKSLIKTLLFMKCCILTSYYLGPIRSGV